MKNKDFMIFQTAVRKYSDMHEKSQSGYFFYFIHRFQKKIIKKIRRRSLTRQSVHYTFKNKDIIEKMMKNLRKKNFKTKKECFRF